MRSLRPAVLLLALAPGAALSAPAEKGFVVTSRGLAEVAVDAGRVHGVRVGDRFRVVQAETPIAELEVISVAERSAFCRTISAMRPITVGDVVVPLGSPAPAPTAAANTVATSSSATTTATFAALKAPDAAPTAPRVTAPPPPAPVVAQAPTPPSSVPSSSGPRFTVKYRSASNVYLDAGRAAGLSVGDRLRVVSGRDTVGEVEVVYVAEQSASCKIVSETRPVRSGNVAVLLTRASPPAPAAPAAPPPAAAPPTSAPAASSAPPATTAPSSRAEWARVRGSASLGYYKSWDQTESSYDFEERTARLDLVAYDLGGQPLSFTLRGRSRQDIRARALSDRTPKDERTDRLYEVALRYEPPSDAVGFEVGRIGLYRFVGIGYLDGALARFRPAGAIQLGAFAGRVADVDGLGFNGTGSKLGGFVRLVPGDRYAMGGYDVMLAYVRENADGDVSREYLSLESRFSGGSRWSLFQRAELDFNTGWRKEVTSHSTELSNVSLSGNLRMSPSAWAFVSYDGRRNYRYYVNRVVPEEVFDDLLHQGLRAGVNMSRPGGFGATAGVGMSLKEKDPRHPELDVANAYSGNAGVRHVNLFGSGFSVGIDGSGFSNGYTDGGLLTARVGRRFAGGHVLDLSFGRSLYRVKLTEEDRSTQWLRLLGRAELGHRVYCQGDFEYDRGDDLKGPRGFLEVGILF